MKAFFKSLTEFNRKERRGLLILAIILLFLTALRFIVQLDDSVRDVRVEYIIMPSAEQIPQSGTQKSLPHGMEEPEKPPVPVRDEALFFFDPNTLDSTGWVKLGLSPRQASAVVKYRQRGGRFRKAEDVARLKVISPEFYERVRPYIRIEGEEKLLTDNKNSGPVGTPEISERASVPVILTDKTLLDLNTASVEEMARLPGVSEQLAEAIVRYRDKWQGFDSIEQLKRVRGVSDTLFRRLRPRLMLSAPRRTRINLNYATEEEMTALPGIGVKRARLLRQSRLREGPFRSFSDLRNRNLLPDSVLRILENRIEF